MTDRCPHGIPMEQVAYCADCRAGYWNDVAENAKREQEKTMTVQTEPIERVHYWHGDKHGVSIVTNPQEGGETVIPFLDAMPLEDGGLSLTLDHRFGLDLPESIPSEKRDEIVEFIANAISVGGGYASIYRLDVRIPFR